MSFTDPKELDLDFKFIRKARDDQKGYIISYSSVIYLRQSSEGSKEVGST